MITSAVLSFVLGLLSQTILAPRLAREGDIRWPRLTAGVACLSFAQLFGYLLTTLGAP